jgi:RHS repeat-associated protein
MEQPAMITSISLGTTWANTRESFGTKTGIAVQYQRDDYYPFGMEANSYVSSPKNYYLYNKKEQQPEFNEYDYGARFYDPVIARFTTIDRFAEKYSDFTTYHYAKDNPVLNIDVNGDSTKISGSTRNVNEYIALLNARTGNTYALKDGFLTRTNETLNTTTNGTISGELSKTIEQAITSNGVIPMNIVKNDDNVLIDSYKTGAVDVGDLKKLNDPTFVAGQIGHIFSERLATGGEGGYGNEANRTDDNFNSSHSIALGTEGKIVTSMLGIPNAARTETISLGPNDSNSAYNATVTNTYGTASYQYTRSTGFTYGSPNSAGQPTITGGHPTGGRIILPATKVNP